MICREDFGALLALIAELNRQIGDLEAELTRHFETHPDADTQRRHLPLPARNRCHPRRPWLGEFSDDVDRYTNAKSRKNYSGTSPLTVASGKKRAVLARHIRNRRLYDAIDRWAFCALSQSPAARAFYDQHRATGDPSAPRTRQQTCRAPARVRTPLHRIRRTHRLGTPHRATTRRSLTSYTSGISRVIQSILWREAKPGWLNGRLREKATPTVAAAPSMIPHVVSDRCATKNVSSTPCSRPLSIHH